MDPKTDPKQDPGKTALPEDSFWGGAPLFRGLDTAERESIQSRFPWQSRSLATGELAALMGDPLERLCLVGRGSLSAEVIAPQGVLRIEVLKQGDILAGPVLFTAQPRIPVQLRALEDTMIVSLPRPQALELLGRFPRVLENFLGESGEKILFLAEKIRLLQFASLREKIAGHFLELGRRQKQPQIQLDYNLEVLADLLGVTRPALSRCLGQMEQEGCLERLGSGRYRLEATRLEALLEDRGEGL